MFNLVVQAVIPQTNCAQFILPSTIGQQTLYGGINGQYSHLFKLLNREVHKSTNELSAFTSMVFDLMSQTMEKEGKEKCDLSLTDAGQLAHQFYLDELDMNQNKQQLEGQKNIVRFNKDLSHSKISNWRHKAILMSGCSSTDYNILQCIPSIKPFVLLSRHGQISCGIPVRYDQLPFRDLGMRTFSSAVSAANFGNRWINPQAQLFPSYDEYEGIQYRKYVQMEIDEELAESGTLSIIPQYSVMRYHIPVYPLRIGKFYDSQILYGISPHPIQAENYQWRTLEPWQIRKTVTMMGVEQDVRQRWKLSERERIRNLLGLAQNSDDEEKDQQLNATLISNKTKEQKQQLIKLLKEIRNNDHEEDVKKRFNQLRSDLIDTNMIFNESNNQNFKTDSQTQISLLKGKVKSLSTYIYPEITTSNTELTIHQPTMVHLQEQMSQQYQKKNDILLYLTNDTLEHPIPLNNIQKATIQEHLLKLPKEYL
ncbi:MAG: hypothetical protein EZS28_020120 [Streblomastix strix]|uniref:Uncharacterized protein n=1 Tax=Streblomastix strix TaxID=222440 RepID=A0A5J4VP92_9EUKA|nr:MAG: hypothetical protein EZS28_020120 [Streblomastix strix]